MDDKELEKAKKILRKQGWKSLDEVIEFGLSVHEAAWKQATREARRKENI